MKILFVVLVGMSLQVRASTLRSCGDKKVSVNLTDYFFELADQGKVRVFDRAKNGVPHLSASIQNDKFLLVYQNDCLIEEVNLSSLKLCKNGNVYERWTFVRGSDNSYSIIGENAIVDLNAIDLRNSSVCGELSLMGVRNIWNSYLNLNLNVSINESGQTCNLNVPSIVNANIEGDRQISSSVSLNTRCFEVLGANLKDVQLDIPNGSRFTLNDVSADSFQVSAVGSDLSTFQMRVSKFKNLKLSFPSFPLISSLRIDEFTTDTDLDMLVRSVVIERTTLKSVAFGSCSPAIFISNTSILGSILSGNISIQAKFYAPITLKASNINGPCDYSGTSLSAFTAPDNAIIERLSINGNAHVSAVNSFGSDVTVNGGGGPVSIDALSIISGTTITGPVHTNSFCMPIVSGSISSEDSCP